MARGRWGRGRGPWYGVMVGDVIRGGVVGGHGRRGNGKRGHGRRSYERGEPWKGMGNDWEVW